MKCWRSPAAAADQFALEFYPRLRAVAEVTSSDGSFAPPEITGPEAVLQAADYRAGHHLVLSWFWSYRLGDRQFRIPADGGDTGGVRDPDAERDLAAGIDAPLEWFGLRDAGSADRDGPGRHPHDALRHRTPTPAGRGGRGHRC